MVFSLFNLLILTASVAESLNCSTPFAAFATVNTSAFTVNSFVEANTNTTALSASDLRRAVAVASTPTATHSAGVKETKDSSSSNNSKRIFAVPPSPSPVVEEEQPEKQPASSSARNNYNNNNNNKLEVSLTRVGKDGKATKIALGSLDDIPQVRRLVTRAPKGRLMLRHPSDPTVTWSVSEDDLYEWLLENGLQWSHDFDFVDNDSVGEQDVSDNNNNNSINNNDDSNNTSQSTLSLKDAMRASVADAVRQVKEWIRNFLWWTAVIAFLAICLWMFVVALTLDMEASRRRDQGHREREMLRVASCHAAALRQTGQRPFFLCPQQWEEQCLDQAMKQLYGVSYYETRHYRESKNNSNGDKMGSSSGKHVYYGYQQPSAQSQIYRGYY